MTTMSDAPEPEVSDRAWRDLAVAARQLREQPLPRAVEVAADILQRAVRASRSSLPVRANPPYDFVRVSDQVLIARLRQAIDAVSDTCAVGQVILRVDPDQVLEAVTVELFVQYGEVLMETADAARDAVDGVLVDLLGPASVTVRLVATHMHVSDVTLDSPHRSDPSDPD